MGAERDGSPWLAKARQLKERALGTADKTQRKHFLLIATEYQKLARQEDDPVALAAVERTIALKNNRSPRAEVVTRLRVTPRQTPANDDIPTGVIGRTWHALRRPEVMDVTIWAILALIAFALLMMPGDQTVQGLRQVTEWLAGPAF